MIVARQDPKTRSISPVGVLRTSPAGFVFAYLQRVRDIPGFRPLLGFADLTRHYRSKNLFPLFSQRIMNRRRPDYQQYLNVLGLSANSSELTILGRSGGRRAGDAIFLVPEPHVNENGQTSATFFVHGLRHLSGHEARISQLRIGELLELRDNPENPANPRALLVTGDGVELGWVPDLLLDYVHAVRNHNLADLHVAQINGADAPPNLRLRVEFSGFLAPGYQPFRGPDWEISPDRTM
ncbi:HIRAN domain-containing protein [Sinosporangium album]|uniref:HIRAN domain-containing protein n=1 Tax=Sinosporangium album TaxID=504805 RepID=UPI00115FDF4B|nr:HIRAN domain-containing protein [Sinosporangium album]